jgi:hypothetical protein
MTVRRMRRIAGPLLVMAGCTLAGAAPAAAQTKTTKPAPRPAQGAPLALPPEAYLLPADSAMVFGADVHGFFASKLWADITSGKLTGSGLTPEKAAEAAKQAQDGLTKAMTEMERDAGFRADRDLDWVFMGMANPEAATPDMAGVALGRFDAARIMAAAEASQAKDKKPLTRKQVGGVTVLVAPKTDKGTFGFAVASPRHIVFGDLALVEAALQAQATQKRPLDANATMVTRLRGLRAGTGVFVLAGEALMQKAAQSGTPAPFPMPRNFGLTFAFDGGTEIVAEMPAAKDATNAADMIRGQLGMVGGMLAADNDPQKALAGKLLSGLTVTAEDKTLRLSLAPGGSGLGALAALAVPSMLKAKSAANESAAIGDIRTVISAEAAYQSTNAGAYGDIACLSAPDTCLKGYKGPVFLDTNLSSLEVKGGYRRAFHPGKKAKGLRSWQSFAYTAVPATPGDSGTRSFCGESTGVIRFDPTGADIKPVGGVCPATLKPLE